MCDVIDNTVSGGRVVRFDSESQEELHKIIDRIGTSPLPPYITRDPEPRSNTNFRQAPLVKKPLLLHQFYL
jgi:S-adenosylmethionine:tRNA ribosyltransferase-isomerase